jgi:hypothetical protein
VRAETTESLQSKAATKNARPIIRSAVAKPVYELFEQPAHKYGLNLEDCMGAEKQRLANDSSGHTSAFLFVIECPGDSEGTAVLVVLRNHARHICRAEN